MISARTTNRIKKVNILKECLNIIVDLLLLDHIQREKINMAKYKEILKKLKDFEKELESIKNGD